MLRRAIFLTIAVWAAAAGAAAVRDIPYASVNGKFGLGDLYLPEKVSPKTPVVLAIHGGGWGAGDRYSWSGVADFWLIPEIETRIATFMKNEKLKKGEKQFKACQAKQDRVAIDWMRFESRFDITRNN